MDIVFQKSKLPFLKTFEEHRKSPRDCWTLARYMQLKDGFRTQDASVFMLLQAGAMKGDSFSMCELGRFLYDGFGDAFLPVALSWWHKAVRLNDEGAMWDVENRPLPERIRNYNVKGGYPDIEMRCVMLTDLILLRLGKDVWNELSPDEQEKRIRTLIGAASQQLFLPHTPPVRLQADYRLNGSTVDGTAMNGGELVIRREIVNDFTRLIQVIFHELGHYVEYAAEKDPSLRVKFGLSDARIAGWARGDMGLEVSMFEEDADTLSYGVYTHYTLLFG